MLCLVCFLTLLRICSGFKQDSQPRVPQSTSNSMTVDRWKPCSLTNSFSMLTDHDGIQLFPFISLVPPPCVTSHILPLTMHLISSQPFLTQRKPEVALKALSLSSHPFFSCHSLFHPFVYVHEETKQNKKKRNQKCGALAVPKPPPLHPYLVLFVHKRNMHRSNPCPSKTIPKRVQGVFQENSIQ